MIPPVVPTGVFSAIPTWIPSEMSAVNAPEVLNRISSENTRGIPPEISLVISP